LNGKLPNLDLPRLLKFPKKGKGGLFFLGEKFKTLFFFKKNVNPGGGKKKPLFPLFFFFKKTTKLFVNLPLRGSVGTPKKFFFFFLGKKKKNPLFFF